MVAGAPMRYDIKPVMSGRTYRVEDISHSEGVYRKTGRFYIAGAVRNSKEFLTGPKKLRQGILAEVAIVGGEPMARGKGVS